MISAVPVRDHIRRGLPGGRLLAGLVAVTLVVVGLIAVPPAHTASAAVRLSSVGGTQIFAETPAYGNWWDNPTEQFSSPAIADLDGNGVPDIIAGFPDGHVYAWRTDNRLRWLDLNTGPGTIQGAPVIIDLDRDGRLDVLVTNLNGDVTAWNWNAQQIFHAGAYGGGQRIKGVFASPVVADFDGDGSLDVAVTGWDGYLHAWRRNGTELPGFPIPLGDTSWSSPALADLDGDGRPEIVFGYDCDAYPGQDCTTPGGFLGAVHGNGQRVRGFPKFIPGQVVWSSPAIGDLDGDGRPDIVVGTGNMPANYAGVPMRGTHIYGFRADGSNLPGWPVYVGNNVTSSPALGDLDGDGRLDVAAVAEDGRLFQIRGDGRVLSTTCVANDNVSCAGKNFHTSVAIADAFGDGRQRVFVGGEQWLSVIDANGYVSARNPSANYTHPMTAAPAVAQVGGRTWVVAVSSAGPAGPGQRGGVGRVFAWSSDSPMGPSSWPTARGNNQRTGSIADDKPPTVSIQGPGGTASTTKIPYTWSGDDVGTGVRSFDVETSENGGPWARWVDAGGVRSRSGNRASGGDDLWTLPNRSYRVRARSRDGAGQTSGWAVSPTVSTKGAKQLQPFNGLYTVAYDGRLGSVSSPIGQGPGWGYSAARGVAARKQGGGYVLDYFGGVHPFSAPALKTTGYWPGQDVTRGLVVGDEGDYGYVLDRNGALHPFGSAPRLRKGPWWPGQDVTRGIAMIPGTKKSDPGGYVVDLQGGVTPFGSAPDVRITGWWPGQDVARGVAVNPDGSGYVVDRFGGLHSFGGAARPSKGPYWPGQDIVRGVVSTGTKDKPAGYILDYKGGVHPFGSAPTVDTNLYGNGATMRAISVARR